MILQTALDVWITSKNTDVMNLIESVRTRREAGAAHRQLRRELSAVTTPAQVNDLLALVARSDDPTAAEIRDILSENLGRCA